MSESFDRPTDAFDSSAAGSDVGGSNQTVAIHQPNYLPWLGYFEKIKRSDVFVLLDDAEYSSGSWINRNKIKTPHGWTWLTVPVRGTSGPIADVEIVDDGWRETHRKSLQASYGGAAHYEEFGAFFAAAYARSWESLCELNVHLIRRLADRLDIDCEFVRASTLEVDATGSERIVRLCAELGADRYYSGEGARSYNDPALFEDAGIALEYQSFEPPRYEQRFDGFLPTLSVVDPLMNLGAAGTRELLEVASGDA